MRTDREFVDAFVKTLAGVDPATRNLDRETLRKLALTEICLHLLATRLPGEDVGVLPYLMLGYPKAILDDGAIGHARALAVARHLASRYVSVSAWLDACRYHETLPETYRCYAITDRVPQRRHSASAALLALLEAELERPTPWIQRDLKVASPGDALVRVNRGETLLAYRVPTAPDNPPLKHELVTRRRNAPITMTLKELQAIARRVDDRENQEDWPETLPRLRLSDRLSKLSLKGIGGKFFDGETLTLDGAVHVLGMLSSGKSTLVWLITFALALGQERKRIGILVSDTIQGANLVARLRRHGIAATVLSSFYNRDRHLNSMHWQQGLSPSGWSLGALGDLAENFSVACPLDGYQKEPVVVRGASHQARFPAFREKPCHRLIPQRRDAERVDDDEIEKDDGLGTTRSCPLWSACPAQEQQRASVNATIVALTPQAFVHMTPDKWTTASHLTLPELFQYEMDLVVVDEVDSVQKALDDIFAPRSPIMGDERNVYAPAIGARSSEALRERSGQQFRRQVNAKWQANFHTFYRLIGSLYALLQNESADLKSFYENTPFTAGSILYEIWRRRQEMLGRATPGRSFDDPRFEEDFLEVIKVASAISDYSRAASVNEDQRDTVESGFRDEALRAAAEALKAIAREAVVSDYYEDLTDLIEAQLDGALLAFNSAGLKGGASGRRGNALALLLAIISELVLMHYYWLVKTQPSVATDFGIDEAQLLSQANNLLKHYRTLLPSNPAGGVFGLLYDEPPIEKRHSLGGKLTLINHLGVGRHLITHLHDLLAAEGQAGPHVLMLSGTSWAGGSKRRKTTRSARPMDVASPSFDVQVPAQGVLMQPQMELEAISRSRFELVSMRKPDGRQIRISGLPERDRRQELAEIARRLGTRRDEVNSIEASWDRMAASWGDDQIEDRRRALLVTNSYADTAVVADTLLETLEGFGYADWKVFGLTRDRAEDEVSGDERRMRRARELPRSLIERFGDEPERSVLVAPMQIVARGHNILNGDSRAAISSIYFLHRPHPRPDDLSSVIGRLNRFAEERFETGMRADQQVEGERLAQKARRMRYAATNIVRYSLYARGGYSELSTEYKAQFAWDMLTPIWQTIGRGIRNGCPVHIGFIDRQFAPLSFDGGKDTPESSVLVQAIRQLQWAMEADTDPDAEIPGLLYRPFLDALTQTQGLHHAQS